MDALKHVKIYKRGQSYQLYYYTPAGERWRLSAGNNFQQAEKLALQFTDWLLAGKDPEYEIEKARQKEQVKAISLKDFFSIFM